MAPTARVSLLVCTCLAAAAAAAAQDPAAGPAAPPVTGPAAISRELRGLAASLGVPRERQRAQMELCRHGAAAARAIAAELAASARVPRAQRAAMQLAAIQVLQELGPSATAAVPALLQLLAEPDPGLQRHVIWSAVGDLLPWCDDRTLELPPSRDTRDRMGMGRAMARQQLDPAALLRDLPAALRGDDAWARELAVDIAGRSPTVRNDAVLRQQVILALNEVVADRSNRRVVVQGRQAGGAFVMHTALAAPRAAAQLALARLDPDAPHAIDGHLLRLKLLDPRERMEAAMALGRAGGAASRAVPALIAALHTPDAGVQREVVTALGMIGVAARMAVPQLQALAQHADAHMAARAKAALRQIGPVPASARRVSGQRRRL